MVKKFGRCQAGVQSTTSFWSDESYRSTRELINKIEFRQEVLSGSKNPCLVEVAEDEKGFDPVQRCKFSKLFVQLS